MHIGGKHEAFHDNLLAQLKVVGTILQLSIINFHFTSSILYKLVQ